MPSQLSIRLQEPRELASKMSVADLLTDKLLIKATLRPNTTNLSQIQFTQAYSRETRTDLLHRPKLEQVMFRTDLDLTKEWKMLWRLSRLTDTLLQEPQILDSLSGQSRTTEDLRDLRRLWKRTTESLWRDLCRDRTNLRTTRPRNRRLDTVLQ